MMNAKRNAKQPKLLYTCELQLKQLSAALLLQLNH